MPSREPVCSCGHRGDVVSQCDEGHRLGGAIEEGAGTGAGDATTRAFITCRDHHDHTLSRELIHHVVSVELTGTKVRGLRSSKTQGNDAAASGIRGTFGPDSESGRRIPSCC